MEKQDMSQVAKRIRSLMREKKYREVVKIAKSLNLNRINNGLLILDIVEAYEKLGDKKAAKTALLNYYDVHGITGRNMMQKLIELCIETRDISNAVGLCMEFENEWPESSISYLMRYQITASAGGSLDERIYYLEKYRESEFEERWGYELAKLYDKNNQKEKCAEVCHEIICLFGTGKYVEKAIQLKERTTGLTEDEINIAETAKRREEEARERREEEERLAHEEMVRLAEEEARRIREQEERRRQEEENRRQEEERRNQEEELRRKLIAEERTRLQQQEEEYRRKKEAEVRETGYSSWGRSSDSAIYEERISGRKLEETDEEYAARRARQAENEKIRQTEEAARLLREKKEADRIAREQKIAEALKISDRYAQIEKNKSEGIYFDDIIKEPEFSGERAKQRKNSSESKGIFSSFGRMASNVRKTLQPDEDYLEEDDTGAEIEYITVGRNSQAYVEDIEERMLSELDMLNDDQIDELTSTQIKEIYELKVLRDVRENIKSLIVDMNSRYHKETPEEELEKFVNTDPYTNPLEAQGESEPAEQENEEAAEEPETAKKLTSETEEESVEEPEKEENAAAEAEETVEEEADAESGEGEETAEEAEETVEEEADAGSGEGEEAAAEAEEIVEKEADAESGEGEETTVEEEEAGEDFEEGKNIAAEEDEKSALESQQEELPVESEETEISAEEPETEAVSESGTEERSVAEEQDEITIESENKDEPEETQKEEPVLETEVKETILDRIADPDANLTVKEFTECITAYAESKGYQVEDTAYMTIAVLAEEMQIKETPLSLNNARIMADDAITRIQKRNPFDKIVDRYSKKHAYLLKDKHFYWKA